MLESKHVKDHKWGWTPFMLFFMYLCVNVIQLSMQNLSNFFDKYTTIISTICLLYHAKFYLQFHCQDVHSLS